MSRVFTAGYYAARAIQFVLVAVALILVVGGLQMNVLAFAAITLVALFLFAGVGIVELLAVRPLERRSGPTERTPNRSVDKLEERL